MVDRSGLGDDSRNGGSTRRYPVGELGEFVTDRLVEAIEAPDGGAAQVRLEFGEREFDRIEVGGGGREGTPVTGGGFDRTPDGGIPVHAEVVQYDLGARRQCRNQPLLHPANEELTGDGTFKNTGSTHPARCHRHQTRHIRSMVAGHGTDYRRSAWGTGTPPGHHGLGAGLVKEEQRCGIDRIQVDPPLMACLGIPFGGNQGLF